MKTYFLFVLILSVILISGCVQQQIGCPEDAKVCPNGTTVSRNPALNCEFDPCPETQKEKPIEILIKDYGFSRVFCEIDHFGLSIEFIDTSKERGSNSISFRVTDPENETDNLLKVGSHPATGYYWDDIVNWFKPSYSVNYLKPDEMEIVLENISISDKYFNGTGYIEIKKRINVDIELPKRILINGSFIYEGDPEYEKYRIKPQYFPSQTIPFQCVEGIIWSSI